MQTEMLLPPLGSGETYDPPLVMNEIPIQLLLEGGQLTQHLHSLCQTPHHILVFLRLCFWGSRLPQCQHDLP